jgi:hypothetical protein
MRDGYGAPDLERLERTLDRLKLVSEVGVLSVSSLVGLWVKLNIKVLNLCGVFEQTAQVGKWMNGVVL